jgi:ABC-type oligopeptide transport system ATPase subunit
MADATTLFNNPQQAYTQELLAAVPIPDPARAHRARRSLATSEK